MITTPPQGSLSVPAAYRLSKSRFLAAQQCEKRLYLEIHRPELATPPDAARQAILDMGSEVGALARQRFPGGVLVEGSHRRTQEVLAKTAALMADPAVPAIFEGAFQFNHVLVRVDILVREPASDGTSRWHLMEVKASTKTKEVHLDDVAIQLYVLQGAGVRVDKAGLLYVNSQYLYEGGDPDVERLFTLRDLTGQLNERLSAVPGRLAALQALLFESTPPPREPSSHCHTPHECPFWSHCTKDKPARWVYHLPGGGELPALLLSQGIDTIDLIPADVRLSAVQRRVKDNVEWKSAELCRVLESVRYPVHHMDFETFMPAVPKFPATRPYQVLPTQWSNHIEQADGTIAHHEYLCRLAGDPREAFVTTLLNSLGDEGSICVYSAYERSILERLAETFPAFERQLLRVIGRLWDLYEVIKAHYYHPSFSGSYSIKAVLPALVPALGYDDLEVQDGTSAARAYYRMIFHETDWVEQERMAEALSRYCARDTRAMLEVRRVLKAKALA